ncbi:MAG: hypothetical protein SPE94_01055 [Collinsella sp.]|nr:hypothetical protein [Collinsella sp.]
MTVVDFQADFLAQVKGVIRVVADDGNGFAVDEPVERQRGLKRFDLFDDLRHLTLREWTAIQAVYAGIVVKQDFRPVADKVLFGRVAKNTFRIVPTVLFQHSDNRFFERSFFIENHGKTYLRNCKIVFYLFQTL